MRKNFLAASLTITMLMCGTAQGLPTEPWQAYFDAGKAALSANDSAYALFKFRQAWLAVNDANLEAEPYQQLRTAYADACEQVGCTAEANFIRGSNKQNKKYSMSEVDSLIRKRETINRPSEEFDVVMDDTGSLKFFAKPDLYAPTAGYCGTSPQSSNKGLLKALELQREHQKSLHEKMPIVFQPGTTKYSDLLSLCQPLKTSERKTINFDLNPFLPKEFKTAEDP